MPKVKLGDVAIEYNSKHTGPKEGIPIVGLEHLMPGEVTLSTWDIGNENTFSKAFRKGQVLFGRRRAYLKKAAVAPFDGICSGDITVIEAVSSKIIPELLPFLIQNDQFFDYSIGKSAGSLSPRVKWEDLAKYEFALPPIDEQKRLAELLWNANEVKVAYSKLLKLTEDLIKSQFIEIFGDPITNSMNWEVKSLKEIADYYIGLTYKPTDENTSGVIVLRSGNIQNGRIDLSNLVRVSTRIPDKLMIKKNDILMCSRNGSERLVGKVALLSETSETMTFGAFMTIIRSRFYRYLHTYFELDAFRSQITSAKTTTINQITKAMLDEIKIPIPPMDLQSHFAAIVETTNRSKSVLQQNLDQLSSCMNTLMNQTFDLHAN